MPSRKTTKAAAAAATDLPSIPKELIDQFVKGPMSAEAVQAASMAFKKALIERALSQSRCSPRHARRSGARHRIHDLADALPDQQPRHQAKELLVEFDYERDLAGLPRRATRFALAPATCFLTNHESDLDYTVVAVGDRATGAGMLEGYRFLPISAARDKHQLGDHANIIQHPDGRMKEAVLRENQLVSRASTTLHYAADTEPGSDTNRYSVPWKLIGESATVVAAERQVRVLYTGQEVACHAQNSGRRVTVNRACPSDRHRRLELGGRELADQGINRRLACCAAHGRARAGRQPPASSAPGGPAGVPSK